MKINHALALSITAVFALSYPAFSADEDSMPPPSESSEQAAPSAVPDSGAIKSFRTNCYTDVRDCAGVTKIGPTNIDIGCTIWWNDGAAGLTNFTLRAGSSASYNVRFNDTGACIALQYAPPKYENGRWYLWVQ